MDFQRQRVGRLQRPRPKTVFLNKMLSSPCLVLFDCPIFSVLFNEEHKKFVEGMSEQTKVATGKGQIQLLH